MNTPVWLHKLLGLATLAASLIASTAYAQTSTAPGSRRIEWLERPWGLQYVLYVTDRWGIEVEVSQERAAKRGAGDLDFDWQEIIARTSFHQSRDKWAKPGDGLSVVLIEFDRDGKVTSPHSFPLPLYGKLTNLLYVKLSPGDSAMQPRFGLGRWFRA